MNDVHIPLREYLADQERSRREWMSATFATKDDLAPLRAEVSSIKGKAQMTWGAAGTFVGGLIVGVASFFGIKPGGP